MSSWLKRRTAGSKRPANGAADQTPARTHRSFPAGIKPLHAPEESLVDIVFVHGLTGDREGTWTAQSATKPWPEALLPSKISNARILAFGYDANVTGWRGLVSKNTIGNHATNLITALATYREEDDTNDRPLIFVCHSLGGLVCEDALVTARQRPEQHLQNILQYTRGIVFLGTPHHGSGLASWAEKLARSLGLVRQTNTDIVKVLKEDSEVLARIQDSFHTMIRARNQDKLAPIEITCFYEELPLVGIGVVVPSHSAILPGYIPIGIHANHMDMTKFSDTDDPGFKAVTGELQRWIKAQARAGVTSGRSTTRSAHDPARDGQERQVLRITQGGSSFGSTTVSGGTVFQGNYVG